MSLNFTLNYFSGIFAIIFVTIVVYFQTFVIFSTILQLNFSSIWNTI